jgi:hypothetical protein
MKMERKMKLTWFSRILVWLLNKIHQKSFNWLLFGSIFPLHSTNKGLHSILYSAVLWFNKFVFLKLEQRSSQRSRFFQVLLDRISSSVFVVRANCLLMWLLSPFLFSSEEFSHLNFRHLKQHDCLKKGQKNYRKVSMNQTNFDWGDRIEFFFEKKSF